MSRELFRLVGVRSGCWVVRDAVISCAFNNKQLVNFAGIIIV
jgi:hypothetical protein